MQCQQIKRRQPVFFQPVWKNSHSRFSLVYNESETCFRHFFKQTKNFVQIVTIINHCKNEIPTFWYAIFKKRKSVFRKSVNTWRKKSGIVSSNILWWFFGLLILFKLFLSNLRTNRSISDPLRNKIDSHANVEMGGECGGNVWKKTGLPCLSQPIYENYTVVLAITQVIVAQGGRSN